MGRLSPSISQKSASPTTVSGRCTSQIEMSFGQMPNSWRWITTLASRMSNFNLDIVDGVLLDKFHGIPPRTANILREASSRDEALAQCLTCQRLESEWSVRWRIIFSDLPRVAPLTHCRESWL